MVGGAREGQISAVSFLSFLFSLENVQSLLVSYCIF
jgi:hypothetical protein